MLYEVSLGRKGALGAELTLERSVTCVSPHVNFKISRAAVALRTPGEVAHVDLSLPIIRPRVFSNQPRSYPKRRITVNSFPAFFSFVCSHVLLLVAFKFERSLAANMMAYKRSIHELKVCRNVSGMAIVLTCLHRWVVRLLIDFASLPQRTF